MRKVILTYLLLKICNLFQSNNLSNHHQYYFELKNLLSELSRAERTAIWAQMDLTVNVLSIAVGLFATGRIVGKFGMPVTIALIPLLICAGLLIVAISPFLGAVVALQVIRRAGNYAVTRPAREMLFTRVDRETRFKAKPVIDIVIVVGDLPTNQVQDWSQDQ